MKTKDILLQHEFYKQREKLERLLGAEATCLLVNLINAEKVLESKEIRGVQGWFFQTIKTVEERTRLKRSKQDRIIKKLSEMGLIEKTMAGLPCKRYFRIVQEKLFEVLDILEILEIEESEVVCKETTNKVEEQEQENKSNQTNIVVKKEQDSLSKEDTYTTNIYTTNNHRVNTYKTNYLDKHDYKYFVGFFEKELKVKFHKKNQKSVAELLKRLKRNEVEAYLKETYENLCKDKSVKNVGAVFTKKIANQERQINLHEEPEKIIEPREGINYEPIVHSEQDRRRLNKVIKECVNFMERKLPKTFVQYRFKELIKDFPNDLQEEYTLKFNKIFSAMY